MFHKVVWQHMQGVVGFLVRFYFIFLLENRTEKEFLKSVKIFDRDITMSI